MNKLKKFCQVARIAVVRQLVLFCTAFRILYSSHSFAALAEVNADLLSSLHRL